MIYIGYRHSENLTLNYEFPLKKEKEISKLAKMVKLLITILVGSECNNI